MPVVYRYRPDPESYDNASSVVGLRGSKSVLEIRRGYQTTWRKPEDGQRSVWASVDEWKATLPEGLASVVTVTADTKKETQTHTQTQNKDIAKICKCLTKGIACVSGVKMHYSRIKDTFMITEGYSFTNRVYCRNAQGILKRIWFHKKRGMIGCIYNKTLFYAPSLEELGFPANCEIWVKDMNDTDIVCKSA